MKVKRLWILLLLLAMTAALMSGCGQQDTADTAEYSSIEDLSGKRIGVITGDGSAETAELPPAEAAEYSSAADLSGRRVGVITGTIFDTVAQERIPDVSIEYFNSDPDLAIALDTDKVDAYIVDEPIFRAFSRNYPDQYVVEQLSMEDYAYILPKGSERHETIRAQLDEFLTRAWEDGTIEKVSRKWLDGDISAARVDYTGLTGENGTLRYATSTESALSFDLLADGEYGGYDIELFVLFCREYGYMPEINDYNFSGILSAVTAGKADIGACTISITEERKESLLFSAPNYHGGTVLVGRHGAAELPPADAVPYRSIEDLSGKRIGVVTGTIFDMIAQENIPGIQLEYLNTMSDMPVALQTDKIDAYLADEPIFRNISRNYPDEYIIDQLTYEEYAFLLPKDSERHTQLCAELNEFLAESWEDGTLQELSDKWITGDMEAASIDFSGLTGEKGTLKMAVSSELGAPFTFRQNGEFAGYDIEVIVRFCRACGYALEIGDYSVGGMLTSTSTGKADIAAGCVSITEERKESILFSEPDYYGGIIVVGRQSTAEEDSASGIAESFEKTFLRESRWKLFVNGIGITLLITLLSTVFGTALGFGIYMLYRKNCRPFNAAVNVLMDILEKTPVVVILMILYYIIFGKSNLSGVWVSIIGFSVMFACSFVGTLKVGVMAVDKGQTEASLALGFTDRRSFLRVILPQAAKHFLPNYKGQIVSLLKDTAVVGYIAVQDLTKVGDIVRSRTYEAFFPLVATAVIYFLLAWLLTLLVRRVEFRTDPTRRSREMILKGVKTK